MIFLQLAVHCMNVAKRYCVAVRQKCGYIVWLLWNMMLKKTLQIHIKIKGKVRRFSE